MAKKTEPTADELRAGLRVDKHALDEELEQQPDLFYRVAEAAALAASVRDEDKALMEEALVTASNRARASAADDEEGRVTEARLKDIAAKDKRYLQSRAAFLESKKQCDVLVALREAYEQKGKVLQSLVQLHIAGYFQSSSAGASRRTMDDVAAASTRRALTKKREGR